MAEQNFLGKGWCFPPEFGSNGSNVKMVEERTDVEQALRILFSTALHERLNRPEYGCDLKSFMFEEINNALILKVQRMIIKAIDEFEPRIDLLNMEITESATTARLLLIQIEYRIKAENSAHNMVYPFYLF